MKNNEYLDLIYSRNTFLSGECSWTIEKGYYKGTVIKEIEAFDKEACAEYCCGVPQCSTWTWKKNDNRCYLKKKHNLVPTLEDGYYSSVKTGGKAFI